jgi:hypothetical protein
VSSSSSLSTTAQIEILLSFATHDLDGCAGRKRSFRVVRVNQQCARFRTWSPSMRSNWVEIPRRIQDVERMKETIGPATRLVFAG